MARKKAAKKNTRKKLSVNQLDKVAAGDGLILASDGLRNPDGRIAADESGMSDGRLAADQGLLKRRKGPLF